MGLRRRMPGGGAVFADWGVLTTGGETGNGGSGVTPYIRLAIDWRREGVLGHCCQHWIRIHLSVPIRIDAMDHTEPLKYNVLCGEPKREVLHHYP
jgi:hypothetical protein